jgi:hypothetical protein
MINRHLLRLPTSLLTRSRSIHTTPAISNMLTPPPTPPQQRTKPGRGVKALSLNTIHQNVKDVQYAVRGELATKADVYQQKIAKGETDGLGFDKVVTANIGNPQQKGLDQKPITFWRQVSLTLMNRWIGQDGEFRKDEMRATVDVDREDE